VQSERSDLPTSHGHRGLPFGVVRILNRKHQPGIGENPSKPAGRPHDPTSSRRRKPLFEAPPSDVKAAVLDSGYGLQQPAFAQRHTPAAGGVKLNWSTGCAREHVEHRLKRMHGVCHLELLIDLTQIAYARSSETSRMSDDADPPDEQSPADVDSHEAVGLTFDSVIRIHHPTPMRSTTDPVSTCAM